MRLSGTCVENAGELAPAASIIGRETQAKAKAPPVSKPPSLDKQLARLMALSLRGAQGREAGGVGREPRSGRDTAGHLGGVGGGGWRYPRRGGAD
jgi:hypothetical protein